ncbi:MAG TPA: hypothetical protein VMW69_08550 [Spirochaetia bacterium]|nr:hypothetical protein [Spirochaetia bacterium]
MTSWISDVLVTTGALVLAAGFGFLYYQNLNRQLTQTSQKPIGRVVYKINDAERRFGDRVVWQQVNSNTTLYNLDSIRTVAGSQAVIKLDDGTQIMMQPDSLITLEWGGKLPTVDFLSGAISAVRSGPAAQRATTGSSPAQAAGLVIRSGRTQVSFTTAALQLSRTSSLNVDLTVSSGSASLSASGIARTLSPTDLAAIDPATGTARLSTVALAPAAPDANAIFVTQHSAMSVSFGWKANRRSSTFTLRLSPSADFSRDVQTYNTGKSSTIVRLAPGSYFWRVTDGPQTTTAEELTIIKDLPIVAHTPQPQAQFSYQSQLPLIPFAWSPSSAATGYDLTIASDPKFTNIVDRLHTATPAIALDSLAAGEYYWQVTPTYAFATGVDSISTEPRQLKVNRESSVGVPQPVAPADKSVLDALAVGSGGLLFNWKTDSAVSNWSLLVARDAGLRDTILRQETSGNFFLLRRELPPGTYYWQIEGKTAQGRLSPPSPVRSFTVSLQNAKILLTSPREKWNYDQATFQNVPVVWSTDINGTFRLQLSTRPDFSTIFSQAETTFNNASFGSLPPGTYYWRVVLKGQEGQTLLSSPNDTFTIMPTLLPPRAIAPAPAAVLDLINPKSLDFRWDGDPRSETYDFALYSGLALSAQRVIAKRSGVATNEVSLSDLTALAPGPYVWEVVGHSPGGKDSSPQQTLPMLSRFVIGKLRVVAPPRLLSPGPGSRIDAVAALDSGVTFHWTPPGRGDTGFVDVASDPAFTVNLLRLPVPAGASSLHLSELLSGTYFWRVRATTADGIEAPPSDTNVFTVPTLPPLAQPVPTLPAGGGSVDMSGKSALTLSWHPVADATGYTISLTETASGSPIFKDLPVKGSSYSYDQLQNLNVGSFTWEIQAYQLDRSGKLVRTSAPLSVDFAIVLGNAIVAPTVQAPKRVFVH